MVGCFVGDPVGGEDCHGNSFFIVLSLQDGNFQFLHLECHKTPSTSPAVCKGDPFILAGIAGVCSQDMLDFLDSFEVAANRADSLMDFEDFVGNVHQ